MIILTRKRHQAERDRLRAQVLAEHAASLRAEVVERVLGLAESHRLDAEWLKGRDPVPVSGLSRREHEAVVAGLLDVARDFDRVDAGRASVPGGLS